MFKSDCKAQEALKTLPDKHSNYLIKPAPSYHEIKWENLDVNQKSVRYKRCCITTIFVVVFLFLLTPSAFLVFAGKALSAAGVPEVISGLIGGYLPTILLVIYMSVILPMVINFLVKVEKHSNLTEETLSAL